jgi:hypothetical protein
MSSIDKNSISENSDFDVNFYRTFYKDLNGLSDLELIQHYNKLGKKELRLTSKKNLDDLIATTGITDFDFEFYRSYYKDLNNLGIRKLIQHYNKYGKKEKRVTSQKQLDEEINLFYTENKDLKNFDFEFYRSFYKDLNGWGDIELLQHYNKWGKYEGRIFSNKDLLKQSNNYSQLNNIDIFTKIHPDFDIKYYKDFNEELKEKTNEELRNHYIFNGNENNNRYFENDYMIDHKSYCEYNLRDETIIDYIYNHHNYRKIIRYSELIDYNKQFKRKYFIFNKESFYKFYNGFDYKYYKDKYFKDNNEITEYELLLDYHLKGKNEKRNINNKINLVVYSPPFQVKCGGIVAMHNMAKVINETFHDKISAKLFMHNNIKNNNPFCNNFASIDEINDDTIVVYPEIITGNPLGAKNVIKWILLDLGIEMPHDHYKNWDLTDLVYYWETKENINNYKQLSCPFYHPGFKNNNRTGVRKGSCYLIKKAPFIHKEFEFIHPFDSIFIDDMSLEDINDVFNKCKYFYSYDANTAYIIYAALCGCIPIIYPINGISKTEYFNSRIYNCNNVIYNKGIVYGYDKNEINECEKIIHECEGYYLDFFNLYKFTINNFIEDIEQLVKHNSIPNNSVKNIFYLPNYKTIPSENKKLEMILKNN